MSFCFIYEQGPCDLTYKLCSMFKMFLKCLTRIYTYTRSGPSHVVLSEDALEGGPEVVDEDLLGGVVGLDHAGVHGRNRLLLRREVHRRALIPGSYMA